MVRTPQLASLYAAFVAVVWIALAACSTPAAMTPVELPVIATLIVKPRIATSEPAAALTPIRATLGEAAGVRYVRPMAGDAHLVHLTEPAQRSEVPQLVKQLRASGAFQYVELDSTMKIQ